MSAQPWPVEAAGEAAALLLVDRGLDLATPSAHGPHVLDRIAEMLPRRGGSQRADASMVLSRWG